jgi:hypothetical protein
MATVAICVRGRERIVVVDVAVGAGIDFSGRRQLVRAKQRPTRGRVVKHNISPQRRVVARRAICRGKRSPCRRVHWVIGLLPGRQVALRVRAIGRLDLQIVVVIDVAVRAGVHLARRG